ncbi:MAG: hypothetical protein ACYCTY_04675 [Sulfuricella sp.]
MSLVIFFIYWAVIPLILYWTIRWLWKRAGTPLYRGMVMVMSVSVVLGLLWLALGKTLWLDHQVRELCAKDGGVKVYETVKLPPEKFNQWGQPNFYRPDQGENALGAEYVFKQETYYYKQGNPDLFRLYTQVFRHLDGKLLGESVFYKRGGGGLPGPWHGTSFMCPELSVKADVLRQIFVINSKE